MQLTIFSSLFVSLVQRVTRDTDVLLVIHRASPDPGAFEANLVNVSDHTVFFFFFVADFVITSPFEAKQVHGSLHEAEDALVRVDEVSAGFAYANGPTKHDFVVEASYAKRETESTCYNQCV